MLTADGIAFVWKRLAELGGWRIVVSDGSTSSEAPAELSLDNDSATFTATFGADQANHEWARRQVVASDGTVLDTEDEDQGRKAPGSEWTSEVTVSLSADGAG